MPKKVTVKVKGYLNGWGGMDDRNPVEWGGDWALAPLLSGELLPRSGRRKLVLVDDSSGMKAVIKGWFRYDAAGDVVGGTVQKISYSYAHNGIGAVQVWSGLKWKVPEINAILDKVDDRDDDAPFYNFLSRQAWTYDLGRGGGTVVGSNKAEKFNGGGGHDTVHGLGGKDKLFGKGGEDDLFGEGGRDSLYGNGGGDELYGGAGNDLLKGGSGDDHLEGGDHNDRLYGQGGADVLNGGAGDDRLWGGAGDDQLYDRSGDNTFWGGAGNDFIQGGDGVDLIHGGDGDDEIISSGISENGGDDTVYGDAGDDYIRTNDSVDTADYVDGGADDDRIDTYGGRDILIGGAGDDTLNGGDGRDSLHGGSGDDWLYGDGQGAAERDVFIMTGADEGRDMSDLDIEITQVAGDPFYTGEGPYNGVWSATMDDALMISSGSTAQATIGESFDGDGLLALQIVVRNAGGAVTGRIEAFGARVPFDAENHDVVRGVVLDAVQDALDFNILYDDMAFL
ncbi:calcium-binding protein [Albimonas donghaensis]|nr:calcium-binding protein [Albimonas donghaensis]